MICLKKDDKIMEAAVQKEESKKLIKKGQIEEKFGVDLTNKQWFQCSIEEVKYSTFTIRRKEISILHM